MIKQTSIGTPASQSGIALLEALIAIFLFSLGILALVGLQATMSKNVTEAKLRSEASFLANQLIGQMWLDQPNLASYVTTAGTCSVANNTKCTNWMTSVRQVLPSGSADVTVNSNAVRVTLNWQLPGDGEVPAQFQIDANIIN